MDEESEEDGDAEAGVGVVGSVGDEAFWDFVEGDGDACLEADGEEGVGGDVVVVGVGGGGGVGGVGGEGCMAVLFVEGRRGAVGVAVGGGEAGLGVFHCGGTGGGGGEGGVLVDVLEAGHAFEEGLALGGEGLRS